MSERLLVQLTEAELDAKLSKLASLLSDASRAAEPALLDREGLARMLRCSSKHIDRLRREGLPELPLGDVPRFDPPEVM